MIDRVLIIGSGAREHAIALALAKSSEKPQLICFGSAHNPGIESLCAAYAVGSMQDVAAMATFAREQGATLAIVGPEAPLAAGAADALWAADIPVVGPTKSLARLESSKAFTRDLLNTHEIPGNPFYARFTSMDGVAVVLAQYSERHVIKDDGLAGGKGVKVWGDHLQSIEDSLAFCQELTDLGHPFVIEEKLEGEEFSLISFCDGRTLKHMPLVQDHKRAYEDDRGPNTGGMGTYTDADHRLPFITEEDVQQASAINERIAAAAQVECGHPYQGILYGGFMATANGVRLIEYNARFGDPECLNLLCLLDTDFLAVCRAIVTQTLHELQVSFANKASVCKYVVPEGYPDAPRKGDAVELPPHIPEDIAVFLGAVDIQQGKLVSTGSRTVAIVATATTIALAEALCEQVIQKIDGPFFHRADIGTAALITKRIEHMNSLRNA